jgi:hypothetical protein
MRLNLDKEEESEVFKFKISETQETDFGDFIKNNSEMLTTKATISISSVKKLFNILDSHLDIYCWMLKKRNGAENLMEMEGDSPLQKHILQQDK